MTMLPEDELTRLRSENQALNEQVKLLVQTEQRLYRSQNDLDGQLESIRGLVRFSLGGASAESPDDVIERTVRFLGETFQLEWVGFCWLSPERERATLTCALPDEADVPRTVEPDTGVRAWLASIHAPLLIAGDGPIAAAVRCIQLLRHRDDAGAARPLSGRIACLPVRSIEGERPGMLFLCTPATAPRRARFEDLHERHLPFLQLVVSYLEHALDNATLTTHLRERSAALSASLENLEHTQRQLLQAQKLEAVGRLAGGVAHDFNNLLTVILGYSSTLRAAPLTAAQQQSLQQITEAGQRAAAITGQLLALGRRQFQRRESLSLSQLTGATLELLRRLVGEQITLALELDEDLPPITADRSQVEQAILNLVVNARDAMPGGGRMIVRTRRASLRDAARCDEPLDPSGFAALEVIDDGIGMDENTQSQIFEPFFTTKPPGQGSGLGLAMVYGVVKQSEGHVLVESAPRSGTSFTVLLPFASSAPVLQPDGTAPPSPSPGANVLVAEDEAMIRNVIAGALRGAGYLVRVAANGEEALALVQREGLGLDLLVTDVVMPKLGGVRLAEALRRIQPGLRVVFISGYSEDLIASGHVGTDRDQFLAKPFTAPALLDCVARALVAPLSQPRVAP